MAMANDDQTSLFTAIVETLAASAPGISPTMREALARSVLVKLRGAGARGGGADLRQAVRDYIAEIDHPVPDYAHRRALRNRLRVLAGCHSESANG